MKSLLLIKCNLDFFSALRMLYGGSRLCIQYRLRDNNAIGVGNTNPSDVLSFTLLNVQEPSYPET